MTREEYWQVSAERNLAVKNARERFVANSTVVNQYELEMAQLLYKDWGYMYHFVELREIKKWWEFWK